MSYKTEINDYGAFQVCQTKGPNGYFRACLSSTDQNFINACIASHAGDIDQFCFSCQKPIFKGQGRQKFNEKNVFCMNCQLKGVQP